MGTKIVLCVGPPLPSAVTVETCTIHAFGPSFTHMFDLPSQDSPDDPQESQPIANWRSIPLVPQILTTGLPQYHALHATQPQQHHPAFFTTASFQDHETQPSLAHESAEDALTQFCRASLSALDQTSFLSDGGSLEGTSIWSEADAGASAAPQRATTTRGHLSDLEDAPPAGKITALLPSTVTLNLIVGILSIAQPRIVTTRWGRDVALIEVLVGDETRSGFAVSFWVPAEEAESSAIARLRRQDVVLMENVALHVFRGRVYGQSLRRGLTKVSLLWRRDGKGAYSNAVLAKGDRHPQVAKTKVVRDWVLRFVGADADAEDSRGRRRRDWDRPPDDTQVGDT